MQQSLKFAKEENSEAVKDLILHRMTIKSLKNTSIYLNKL
jgi:hypothetical protein